MSRRDTAAGSVLPLGHRLRALSAVRLALLLTLVTAWAVLGIGPRTTPAATAGLLGGYAMVAVGGWLAARRPGRDALAVFQGALLLDGLMIGWASYGTGGAGSPIVGVLWLHLVAVSLLASFRTSVKIAVWHSLLVYAAIQLHDVFEIGLPQRPGDVGALLIGIWMATLLTSYCAAINERELRRRRLDMEALAKLGSTLSSLSGAAEIAAALRTTCLDDLDLSRALVLAGPGGEWQVLAGATSGLGCVVADLSPTSVLAVCARTRRTQLVAQLCPGPDTSLIELLGAHRNLVVVPLVAENRTVGALVAEHAMRLGTRVERRVVDMVERCAAHAAVALSGGWLLATVQAMADTDGLTGVANRRSFDAALERECARAARSSGSVSLLMVDLDHFKALNDTFGHQAGDQVLRDVAALLQGLCRPFDVVARYGGEEFAVILPLLDPSAAHAVAERLRAQLRGLQPDPGAAAVTASIGVATVPDHASDPGELISAADQALYQAKRRGRDRSLVAGQHEALLPGPRRPQPQVHPVE